MAVKITDMEISCDAILDEAIFSDTNQEIGFLGEEKLDFFEYEEQKDFLETSQIVDGPDVKRHLDELMDLGAREAAGVCECCNGTGSYWDSGPHTSRREPCDNCNGTGFIKDQKPLCPNCKDTGLVESGIPMEGNEECYYCKDHDA